MKKTILSNAKMTKFIVNIWPPFLLSGIKIIQLNKDFKYCKVKLNNCKLTRNINHTHFGGNLFAMVDPIYSLMLIGILGEKYYIWDKSTFIDFINPGRGIVFAECTITSEMIDKIIINTNNGQKYFPKFNCQIKDESDNLIANIHKKLYIRLKSQFRPNTKQ